MKNWYANNSKWLLPTITFLGGIVLGFYLCILRYETKLDSISDDVHDINNLIQNRLLTNPGE